VLAKLNKSEEILKIAAFYYFSIPATHGMGEEKGSRKEDDLVAAKSPNYFHKALFIIILRGERKRERLMVSGPIFLISHEIYFSSIKQA